MRTGYPPRPTALERSRCPGLGAGGAVVVVPPPRAPDRSPRRAAPAPRRPRARRPVAPDGAGRFTNTNSSNKSNSNNDSNNNSNTNSNSNDKVARAAGGRAGRAPPGMSTQLHGILLFKVIVIILLLINSHTNNT